MTEKLSINGKDVWVVVEPLTAPKDVSDQTPNEYFIVFYNLEEPGSTPGEMMRDADNRPKLFESPVAALEYANEKLLGML
jgi:hypothetical protein